MLTARESGVLLAASSLPGPYGHGDLGPEARAFVDFLATAGQRAWQMLPIHPLGPGNSPYSSVSAFAGNPLLISLDDLHTEGLLEASELARKLPGGRLHYARARRYREPLLRRAFERFLASGARHRDALAHFRQQTSYWLADYGLFMALRAHHKGLSFVSWERSLSRRNSAALAAAQKRFSQEIAYYEFEQFVFDRQWRALHAYARERSVRLIGDIPIFVAHDSADVWAHPESFQLDARRASRFVSGVPPDYFSEDGQLWGTPLYAWRSLARHGYAFWIERFRSLLARFDQVRLDHFIGFARYWQVPRDARTARNGRWQKGPGRALFDLAQKKLGQLPFIAEDLGETGEDVVALRDVLGFPGMRILQFGFNSDARDPFLPHNYVPNTVAYPGTHDNDTLLGWLRERASKRELTAVRAYVGGTQKTPARVLAQGLLRALYASSAKLVVVPIQDVLSLDNRARMNLPGSAEGNWAFRLAEKATDARIADQLASLTQTYGR
jgi:4-alpha-glucanotransferase